MQPVRIQPGARAGFPSVPSRVFKPPVPAKPLGARAALLGNPEFVKKASKSGLSFFHNVLYVKIVLSLLILLGAITISVLYNRTQETDALRKKKLRFTSELWFGEQSGLVGTMIILWFPTILFIIALNFIDLKSITP